jgi:hypothetical protein
LDVILQIGAHRTASTSFQTYLRQHSGALNKQGIGFWGPPRLRRGLLHGVIANPNQRQPPLEFARAQGRIGLHLEQSRLKGLTQLVVSDENMLGIMRHNISTQTLYSAAGERLAKYVAAFGGSVKTIHLSLRCPSTYWTSAFSFCIPRGVRVPNAARIAALCAQTRTWRDVITDIAAAAPNVAIYVSTYEQHAAAPQSLLSYLMVQPAPVSNTQIWRNKRPSAQELLRIPMGKEEFQNLSANIYGDQWQPFSQAQRAMLQEHYADDLFWLRSGADGLAHLLEDPKSEKTGIPAGLDFVNKGQRYDARQRMARPG